MPNSSFEHVGARFSSMIQTARLMRILSLVQSVRILNTMQIFIIPMTGQTFSLEVLPDESLESVKCKVPNVNREYHLSSSVCYLREDS